MPLGTEDSKAGTRAAIGCEHYHVSCPTPAEGGVGNGLGNCAGTATVGQEAQFRKRVCVSL